MSAHALGPSDRPAPRLAPHAPPGLADRLGAADSLVLRLAAFAALGWLGAAQWAGLVDRPPNSRALLAVMVAGAGAGALAGLGRVRLPGAVRGIAAALVVLLSLALACAAVGLELRLLAPGNWGALGDGLDRGLVGASSTGWPYVGDDPWVRLTLLLGLPVLLVAAMAVAFWPARRLLEARRALALVLLVALFAIPATERSVGGPLGRGVVLLTLIAAWLWLPRLSGRDLVPAAVALAVVVVAALPLASAARSHQAWVDYTAWNLFAGGANGHSFDWAHRYGPLGWSRAGATMLTVRSPHSHYWKAETLDRFDGLRWTHSDASANAEPVSELPAVRNPRWDERIRFTVRGLKSDLLVGAGTAYGVDGSHVVAGSGDGTMKLLDGNLAEGESYTVQAYVPDPSAAQMRAAPRAYSTQFLSYTYFDLPRPSDSALTRAPSDLEPSRVTERTVGTSVPGLAPGDDPATRRRILASPYARDFRLAARLAAGQRTQYDVVKSVERHLQQGFSYSERPPLRRYPLDAFLFRDKLGYCQQFSGAMALLLRMDGIPARVAGGFSPGIPDTTTHEYRVRDLDAHSWVEVWFSGIGWVPFDPTPSLAPASAQSSGDSSTSAAVGGRDRPTGKRSRTAEAPSRVRLASGQEGGNRVLLLVLGAAALIALVLGATWAAAVGRARRLRRAGGDPDLRELGFALARLGHAVPGGTTLLELERRLRVTAGPGAAAYVAALRRRRFDSPGAAAAARLDRRGLRRGLAAGRGPIVRLRALMALPPRRHPASS